MKGLAYFSAASHAQLAVLQPEVHYRHSALNGFRATWGGYIFVNNLIGTMAHSLQTHPSTPTRCLSRVPGLHAAVLVAMGKYNSGLYRVLGQCDLDTLRFRKVKGLHAMVCGGHLRCYVTGSAYVGVTYTQRL